RDPKNKHIAIVFFGGEPLLNKKLIFKIVKYTNKKCAENNLIPHYSISTNCTLIHGDKQLIDLIRENNFSLCISIDGPPQIHNVNRPFKNEKGSYREVQKGINYLHEEKIHRLRARATYVIGNGHLRDIVFHLNKMGFDRVYVEEVSNLTDKRFSDITNFNYLESEYNKLFSEYKKNILNKKTYAFKVSYFDEILRMIQKGGVKFYYCGAGRTFLSVSSKGEFYPCHRFVGNEDMKVGNVFTGLNEEKLREFINRICVSNRKSCLKCWVRFLCAGGCAYENFVESGSIDGLDILNCIKRRFLLRKFILLYSSLPKEIKDNL
ncbi:SPASM domain-containing protein, partial [Candidatus Aminicenantes bacterium AH-873-B07]|nr:SPASM domain-containing protein [Candidatus Aminicenantes bacterium AH-873-B07]